jgi:hypothetical protein
MSLFNKIISENEIKYININSINNIYNYNTDLNIIICIKCKFCLKDNLTSINHLKIHHKNNELDIITIELNNNINFPIIKNLIIIKNIELYKYYFKDLNKYLGYKYLKYDFLNNNYKTLRIYLNKSYLIKNNNLERGVRPPGFSGRRVGQGACTGPPPLSTFIKLALPLLLDCLPF